MRKAFRIILCMLLGSFLYGQTVTKLYDNRDFKNLVKYEKKTDSLSAEEIYMIGFAFFQLENDPQAVELYDKAIAKGMKEGSVYFYKGLSLRYLKKYSAALIEIETSLKLEPTNQEFMNEKGMVYYSQKKYDKALEIFEEAKKLPNTFPEPYYWVACIYHEKHEFDKALRGYYEALKNLPRENSCYASSLEAIGQLEYSFTKDFTKSAKAYYEMLQLDPENYQMCYKLIKSYNAGKDYAKADSLFGEVQTAFKKGKLPKEDMEIKTISVGEFEWKGQVAVIIRSLVDPKGDLDISYKVFLLNKDGDKVERRFVVEKTTQLHKDGPRHLLCEQVKKTGGHITYPYGWSTDHIPVESLQKAVLLVLEGKMEAGASSTFGGK